MNTNDKHKKTRKAKFLAEMQEVINNGGSMLLEVETYHPKETTMLFIPPHHVLDYFEHYAHATDDGLSTNKETIVSWLKYIPNKKRKVITD